MSGRRPWKVFVRDIGPTFSFATETAATERAEALVAGEVTIGNRLYGNYGEVLVWGEYDGELRRMIYRPDREPEAQVFVGATWVTVS